MSDDYGNLDSSNQSARIEPFLFRAGWEPADRGKPQVLALLRQVFHLNRLIIQELPPGTAHVREVSALNCSFDDIASWMNLHCGCECTSGPHTNRDGSADALNNPHTLFATFHRLVGRGNALQVRGRTRRVLRKLGSLPARDAHVAEPAMPSRLWIKGTVPLAPKLSALKKSIHEFEIKWQTTPWRNCLRDDSRSGFAELIPNRHDRRALVCKLAANGVAARSHGLDQTRGHLTHWLRGTKVQLRQIQFRWQDIHLTRLMDRGSGQAFLSIVQQPGTLPLVANLSGGLAEQARTVSVDGLDRRGVRDFVDSRATWFTWSRTPATTFAHN